MSSEVKFNGKSLLYDRYRPSYPISFFNELIQKVVKNKNPIIADIGAGTGIFTEILTENFQNVIAIEPNDEMRAVLKRRMVNKNCLCLKGKAEKTGLSDRSVDLITVAQAFHWFDPLDFKEECERILKTNGRVMLIWNSRDHGSKLNKETATISKKYCPDFKGFSGGINIEKLNLQTFFTSGYEHYSFSNPLKMTKEQFIGRNLSASYAPKEEDKMYAPFVDELSYLYDSYCSKENTIIVPNDVHVYVGKLHGNINLTLL
ncbi:MAG TPA: class I SAM-dependent methyltransferase [Niallia sp.]|nr:class I SAM-dependent methyltransferase [Niallia sp.]